MDKYNRQAGNFMWNTHTKISIRFCKCERNEEWNDTYARNRYSVRITTDAGWMKFTFWDSIHNTINHKRPTNYDILACLEKYDPGTFENFCDEYGYSDDSIKALKIYAAVKKQYTQLSMIYTDEQMDMLREIC